MALVSRVERDDHSFRSLHPTKLVCKYIVGAHDGKKVLQLNTYGSEDRDIPDKLSQTLQFDEAAAKQLYRILQKEYGFTG